MDVEAIIFYVLVAVIVVVTARAIHADLRGSGGHFGGRDDYHSLEWFDEMREDHSRGSGVVGKHGSYGDGTYHTFDD